MRWVLYACLVPWLAGCTTQSPRELGAAPLRRTLPTGDAARAQAGPEPVASDLGQLQWAYLQAHRAFVEAAGEVERSAYKHDRRLKSLAGAAETVPAPETFGSTMTVADAASLQRTARRYEAVGRSYLRAEKKYAASVAAYEAAQQHLEEARVRYEEALREEREAVREGDTAALFTPAVPSEF